MTSSGEYDEGATVIEGSIRIAGGELLLVPATRARAQKGETMRRANETGRRLREARREAGLTQAQLAQRLGRSQALVSQAESGSTQVNERYLLTVLEACGVKAQPTESPSETLTGWDMDPKDMAGLDPETFQPVRRGSERDIELAGAFVWWDNFRSAT